MKKPAEMRVFYASVKNHRQQAGSYRVNDRRSQLAGDGNDAVHLEYRICRFAADRG
ncbi:hypothetical protein TRP66_08670 [Pseudomonas sp. JDS28PS106]|uniref:hypothetical protein n=1 Tax=Pseudomonas sp. JDS28PS106 TaxID=2497235 RepID=UPI002FD65BA6